MFWPDVRYRSHGILLLVVTPCATLLLVVTPCATLLVVVTPCATLLLVVTPCTTLLLAAAFFAFLAAVKWPIIRVGTIQEKDLEWLWENRKCSGVLRGFLYWPALLQFQGKSSELGSVVMSKRNTMKHISAQAPKTITHAITIPAMAPPDSSAFIHYAPVMWKLKSNYNQPAVMQVERCCRW